MASGLQAEINQLKEREVAIKVRNLITRCWVEDHQLRLMQLMMHSNHLATMHALHVSLIWWCTVIVFLNTS